MSNWGGLDFFIFLIFLVNVVLGMARGASKEIISLICLSAALVFTIKFTIPLTTFINSSPLIRDVISSHFAQRFMLSMGLPALTQDVLFTLGYCISLLVCFVGVFCIGEAVLSYANTINVFSFPYAAMDRKVGATMGGVRGYVITLVFITVYSYFNLSTESSYFVNLLRKSALKFNQLIYQQAPEKYTEVLKDKRLYTAKMVLEALEHPK